jgi:glycosyltransferase involved in cell wall biosynthesis
MRWLRVAVNAEQLLHRSPGGIGRYTAQLLTLLPAAFPDCEVVPFTARHPRAQVDSVLAAAGVPVTARNRVAVQKLPPAVLYQAWVRLGRPAVSGLGGATLVHAPSAAVPPSSGRPLVVTIHDAAPELFPEAFSARGRSFHRLGLLAAARRADAVITVSQSAADEIVSHSPIPAGRIRVVPNGVDPPPADPVEDRRVVERLDLAGRPYVLWVGSLEPRKGVGTLVAAMAELGRRGRHPDVRTVLAGFDGWLQDGLVAPADRARLGPSLCQLGRVSEGELWALYRHAALFAFPSRHEGFGLPVVEAMSQGIAVVASDIPALREVAGAAALLVEPDRPAAWADAIDGLLGDDAARRALGTAGVERSRMFTVGAMAAATHAVYQTVGS